MILPDWDSDTWLIPTGKSMTEVIRGIDPRAAKLHQRVEAERRRSNGNGNGNGHVPHLDLGKQNALASGEIDLSLLTPIDEWIEANVYDFSKVDPITLDTTGKPKIVLEDYQRRILRHIFTPYKNRISKYTTVVWSQRKKSGKTQVAGAVGCYFSQNVDPPNTVLAIANKKDQAEDRVYRSMKATIKALGGQVPTAVNSKPVMVLPNGTQIRALPNSPSTEAGDRYILTLWTEIWAFKALADERLFAELMPVETERVSMRWIETYAGYWDESETLKRVFLKAFKHSDELELQDGSEPNTSRAQYVPELADITTDNRPACVEVPEEELFIFWDHERRMPWQTDEKHWREYKALPRIEAIRLLDNRWQSSSSDMLEEAWIQKSIVRDRWLDALEGKPITLAVDAAMRHDNIALVGTRKIGETYYTPFIELHDPHGHDADLRELVENRVKQLFDEGLLLTYMSEDEDRWITPVYFDPYQLHQIRLNLIAYGVDVIEFSQASLREKADTMLYHLYKDGLIVNPPARADFYEHLRAGKAKYSEGEHIRIVKGTTADSKKIDGLVAQSMSCYGSFLADQHEVTREDTSSLLILGSTKNSWFE